MALPNRAFQSELRQGDYYERLVRGFLANFGVPNSPGPFRGADIVLPDGRTLEVKMRRRTFSGPSDFPDRQIIIDNKGCWDRKTPKPFAYIIVSADTGKMVCTRGNTPERWEEKMLPNNRGGKHLCYVCPNKHLKSIESLIKTLKCPF